jgi:hypothetical protein
MEHTLDQMRAAMPALLAANTRVALQDIRIHKHLSDDSTAFDATLLLDGQPIAIAFNRGDGAPVSLDVLKPDRAGKLAEAMVYVQDLLPPRGERNGEPVYPAYDLSDLIDTLVAEHERSAFLRAKCAQYTVVYKAGDPRVGWDRRPYTQAVAASVRQRLPGGEIVNERCLPKAAHV